VGEVAQRFKANGRIDVIAQNGLAGFELSGEETFNPLAQKLVPESRIALASKISRCRAIALASNLGIAANPGRGRDGGHPSPPAQIRTGATNAYGSYLGCVASKR
jgi:lysophospholipase L1-like esterase